MDVLASPARSRTGAERGPWAPQSPTELRPLFPRARGPVRPLGSDPQPATHERARRIVNVIAAGLLLIVAAPLMLLIAFLVKVTSPGPVLYRQPRVGLDQRNGIDRRGDNRSGHDRRRRDRGGKVFTIFKFRTMRVEQDAPQVWAQEDDPRITPLGRFLRRTRLDELPQLFNILRGDMNLVGPRPEQPDIFRRLRQEVSQYPARQRVLPGITGWAQVNHKYDECIEDVARKVDLDLEYISERSAWNDFRIMVRTIPVMLFGKGSR
ncbi:MAG: sugar transferase [Gemmatimonadetes bacterium]|nr:sugar transferase [Gemmatimonadota bacterium]